MKYINLSTILRANELDFAIQLLQELLVMIDANGMCLSHQKG